MLDLVILGGTVVDGTGGPPYQADLAVLGDKIVCIGRLEGTNASFKVDASGKVVSPGFIDIHQHSDFTPLVNRRCESAVRQGITTAVVGNCGHGCAPISNPEHVQLTLLGYRSKWGIELDWRSYGEYLDRLQAPGIAINLFPLIPHGLVRLTTMGFARRVAGPYELEQMQRIVGRAMEEGAAGLSSGLEYFPGCYADQAELTELARVVGRYNGIYASHIRNRGDSFLEAVDEAIEIGRASHVPIQLSHLSPRPYAPSGSFERVLERIYKARDKGLEIGIDAFPDTLGPSPVAALLPGQIAEAPPRQILKRLRDGDVRCEIRTAFESRANYLLRGTGAEQILLRYTPEYSQLTGKSLQVAAEVTEQEVSDLVCELLLSAGNDLYNVHMEHPWTTKDDLHSLMREPICAFASDGVITAPYGPLEGFTLNSSSYGYTARILGQYTRQEGLFTLEEAVRRMTGLPAALIGLSNRGLLRQGWKADIVIFDPHTVHDNTSAGHPDRHPDGIETVIVNGAVVVHRGRHLGRLVGCLLQRGIS